MNWMNVTVSANGMLLYGRLAVSQIVRVGRHGNVLGEIGERNEYNTFRLSPDRRRVAASLPRAGGSDIWMIDAHRGLSSRFTYNPEISDYPVWSPDARMIAFTFGGPWRLFVKDASGAGEQRPLTRGDRPQYAYDWSRDGRFLLYGQNELGTGLDLWFVPTTADGSALPGAAARIYLKTPFNESRGRFSPEPSPRCVAYESDESGRLEIYARAFPEPRDKVQISAGGGRVATWGTDGKEIFYVSPANKLMQVSLTLEGNSIEPSAPQELFPLLTSSAWYDVMPDSEEFLILKPVQASQPLTAIVNWPVLLKKALPGH
jgi:Tol biopolymer transport system component